MEEVPGHVKKEPLEAWILRAFTGSETDDDLIFHMLPDFSGNLLVVHGSFGGCTTDKGSLSHSTSLDVVAYPCIATLANEGCSGRLFCSAWCYMHQRRLRVRDGPSLAVEDLSYPNDEYIRWYRGITWVYIRNPANRDTRSIGYQPTRVDRRMMTSMLQEVDDMASVVIQEPHSSPS
ncbi:hypothetical protein M9H77_13584 [Catharanthus roseus]|uniref:Uncharacterized protein n=1 Tax=Catharanthus roseus TaxID=4058 RepID=A0ACC0BKJ0_CATRO|nr:hypothetical protein M9H77_13584 [Catharanthus roseus]